MCVSAVCVRECCAMSSQLMCVYIYIYKNNYVYILYMLCACAFSCMYYANAYVIVIYLPSLDQVPISWHLNDIVLHNKKQITKLKIAATARATTIIVTN